MHKDDLKLIMRVWYEKNKLLVKKLTMLLWVGISSATIISLVKIICDLVLMKTTGDALVVIAQLRVCMWLLILWGVISMFENETRRDSTDVYTCGVRIKLAKLKRRFLILYHHRTFKKVEKALGFTLYNWQKEYIVGASDDIMPNTKASGRTTAHMLRTMLGLHLSWRKRIETFHDFHLETDAGKWGTPNIRWYRKFYMNSFFDLYSKLHLFRVRLVHINFDEMRARNSKFIGHLLADSMLYRYTTTIDYKKEKYDEKGTIE